jgi:hypothetical protein
MDNEVFIMVFVCLSPKFMDGIYLLSVVILCYNRKEMKRGKRQYHVSSRLFRNMLLYTALKNHKA